MTCHTFLVTTIQLTAVMQVWLLPCLMSSLFFYGVHNYFIISAVLQNIPILFNLVVMSHYWNKPLLFIGMLANGIGGAGAMATVVISWADPKYSSAAYKSPNMAEGNVILLIIAAITTFSAAMQILLLCMKNEPDRTYSCCWGNFSEFSDRPRKAEAKFIHLIRTMRGMGIIVFLINLFQLWSFAFWFYSDNPNEQLLILRLRVLSLFYFTMTLLWSSIATVISYNINSQRKLRFTAFNSILVLIISGLVFFVSLAMARSKFKINAVGPAPWIMLIIFPFQVTWVICSLILAYSHYPFRSNGCCWPDCTAKENLQEEFEIWAHDDDDGL